MGEDILDTSQFVTGEWTSFDVQYNVRDLLLYAIGIGCANESRTAHNSNHSDLRYVYEQRPNFAAFPTYPLVLSQKGISQDAVEVPGADAGPMASSDSILGVHTFREKKPPSNAAGGRPALKFKGVRVGVDAERYVERMKSIPTRGIPKLQIRTRLYGVQNKGTGALVENESELVGADGSVYYRFVGGGFQIGATGFTSSGKTNSEKILVPSRAPDAMCELVTTPEQAMMYRLSGDYNPQHIDPDWEPVKVTGEAPILHGLCTLGHAARAVLQTCGGNDDKRFHAMKVRFSSPVIPGETLVTKMWKIPAAEANKMINQLPPNCERILFTTEVKGRGTIVVSNSFMDVLNAPEARL